MGNKSMTKEARIYNGEKTVSSIIGPGKTGQLHVKYSNTIYKNVTKPNHPFFLLSFFSFSYFESQRVKTGIFKSNHI